MTDGSPTSTDARLALKAATAFLDGTQPLSGSLDYATTRSSLSDALNVARESLDVLDGSIAAAQPAQLSDLREDRDQLAVAIAGAVLARALLP